MLDLLNELREDMSYILARLIVTLGKWGKKEAPKTEQNSFANVRLLPGTFYNIMAREPDRDVSIDAHALLLFATLPSPSYPILPVI